MAVDQIIFWSGFGFAARWFQLGVEMRPFFQRNNLWTYPCYVVVFGSFGYWMQGISARQAAMINERKHALIMKRERKLQRDAGSTASSTES